MKIKPKFDITMPTYLLDRDNDYMILLFFILTGLNADIRREIYDILLMKEIIEVMTVGWNELFIETNDLNDLEYLFDDLELYRDQ